MSGFASDQRNPYQGDPPRPWIVLRLAAPDGSKQEFKLVADTGNPYALVLSEDLLTKLTFGSSADLQTNFGLLRGAWFLLAMPELGLDGLHLGYVSNNVVAATKESQSDFEGLVGLPLLRLLEYGGNREEFWIRNIAPQP